MDHTTFRICISKNSFICSDFKGFQLQVICSSDFNWISVNILHGIIALFSIVFLILLQTITYLFLVDSTHRGKNAFKREFSYLPLVEGLARFIIQIIYFILRDYNFSAFITGFLQLIFYLLYTKHVFTYKFYKNEFLNTLFLIYLLISVMS